MQKPKITISTGGKHGKIPTHGPTTKVPSPASARPTTAPFN